MASFAGANQLNTLSAEPWNVHSAAAAVRVFFGLADLSEAASAPDAARLAEAAVAPEAGAAVTPEVAAASEAEAAVTPGVAAASEAEAAADTADAARTPEAGRGAFATCAAEAAADAAEAAATSDAVVTCSIDPSTTTREPSIPAPV